MWRLVWKELVFRWMQKEGCLITGPLFCPWMEKKDNYFAARGLAVAGRIYFNPDSRCRIYVLAGAGYISLKHETQCEYSFDWPAWVGWETEPYKENEKAFCAQLSTERFF